MGKTKPGKELKGCNDQMNQEAAKLECKYCNKTFAINCIVQHVVVNRCLVLRNRNIEFRCRWLKFSRNELVFAIFPCTQNTLDAN